MPPKKQKKEEEKERRPLPYLEPHIRRRITDFAGTENRIPTANQQIMLSGARDEAEFHRLNLEQEDLHMAAGNIFGTTQEEYDAMVRARDNSKKRYEDMLKKYAGKIPPHEAWGFFWDDKFYPKGPPPPPPSGGAPPSTGTYGRGWKLLQTANTAA
jgi:hypothetical protein